MRKQNKSLNPSIVLSVMAAAASYSAQANFQVNVTNYGTFLGTPISGTPLQALIDTAFGDLEAEVNDQLPDFLTSADLSKGSSNSTVIAGSGLGLDYSSNYSLFMLGYSAGVAGDPGTKSIADIANGNMEVEDLKGIGFQHAVHLGLPLSLFTKAKLGPIDLARVKVSTHFMHLGLDLDSFSIDGTSFGLGVQYRLVPAIGLGAGALRWDGVDVSSGFRYGKMALGFTRELETVTTTSNAGALGTVNMSVQNPVVDLSLSTSTFTIPVEVSTAVRLGYIFSLYTGGGLDFSFGSGALSPTAEGQIALTGTGITGVTADSTLDLGESSGPSALSAKWFFGLQFDFTVAAMFVQVTDSLSNSSKAAQAGFKAYW